MAYSFTVIVTVYNLGSYLEECLESIDTASIDFHVEVIIVDDGSSDAHTVEVLDKMKVKYPSFTFLSKSNGGPASARNFGIKHAAGDFIVPFDADNLMRSDFFSTLSKSLDSKSSQYDVFYFNALFFGLKDLVWPGSDFKLQDIALENRVDACACIKRQSLIDLGGFDESLVLKGFEDWELWIRMLSSGKRFHYFDEILYDYRVRANSTLADSWGKRVDAVNYMFSKPENHLMAVIRQLSLVNNDLNKPLAFGKLFQLLSKKIVSRIFNVNR